MVTGGGGGIGSACAHRLAGRGDLVVVMDPGVGVEGEALGEATAAETAAAIRARGGHAVHSTASVADREEVERLFEDVRREHGSLDVVVNTAGILRFPPLEDTAPDDWAAVLDVHFNGYLNVLAAALPDMVESGTGRIVGFTSGVGLARTSAGAIAYGCAKRAVACLTWALGRTLPPGVGVNALSPIAATRMVRGSLVAAGVGPAGLDLSAMPPAEAMAPAVDWLTSERSSWLNGQVVFSAGSEISLIEPARLIEAVRSEDVADFQSTLDAVVPVVLGPAQESQRTTGGSNPRLHDVFSSTARPAPPAGRTAARYVVAADDERVTEALAAALRAWGARAERLPATGDGWPATEAALRSAASVGPIDGIIVVAGEPIPAGRAGPDAWQEILRSHEEVPGVVLAHAAWLRAAARTARDGQRTLRVIHVVPAPTDGGATAAQAVHQMSRSANDGANQWIRAFGVAWEAPEHSGLGALSQLVARLACSSDTLPLAGAEMVAADGWVGLRSHPAPAVTVTFGGPEIPPGVEGAIGRARSAG